MSAEPRRDRLRIAVQKNGRLAEPSLALLAQCGINFRQRRDKLFCYGESLAVDLLSGARHEFQASWTMAVAISHRRSHVSPSAARPRGTRRGNSAGGIRARIAPAARACDAPVAAHTSARIAECAYRRLPNLLSRYCASRESCGTGMPSSVETRRGRDRELICDLVSAANARANQMSEGRGGCRRSRRAGPTRVTRRARRSQGSPLRASMAARGQDSSSHAASASRHVDAIARIMTGTRAPRCVRLRARPTGRAAGRVHRAVDLAHRER